MKSVIKLFALMGALTAVGGVFYNSLPNIPKSRSFLPAMMDHSSSNMAQETRQLDNFTRIQFPGSGKLTIKIGPEPFVTIHAWENTLGQVRTEVAGDQLTLLDYGFSRVNYELTVPTLESIHLTGSGDISIVDTLEGTALRVDLAGSGTMDMEVAVDSLALTMLGSGNMKIKGQAQGLVLRVLGSGDLDLGNLKGNSASIEVLGSGDTELGEYGELSVSIMGSGDVTYSGSPQLDARTPGSGEIERR